MSRAHANAAETSNGDAFGDAEPPPAYSSIAGQDGSSTLEANFARPYEIQDSGYTPNANTATATAAASPSSSSHAAPPHHHQHQQAYSQPAGAPPAPPPRHPSSQSNGGSPPQPHIDGISSFTRPALPNQVPAHTAPVAHNQPTQYSPTVNPTSGQPLLHRGKLLVFPQGFYCPKCHNTGYKAFDPSNPHERCWEKYGRQFNSAIWISPNYSFSNPALQAPLPNIRYQANLPPPAPPMQQHPGYYVAPQQQQQPFYPQNGYYGPPPPQQQPMISHHMGYMPMGPPPGALVVRPGDPRIGGRLCYECGGRGRVAAGFLLLDEDTCWACNGTGRVF